MKHLLPAHSKSFVVTENIRWTNGNFQRLNTNFLRNSDSSNEILELNTCFRIFKYCFTTNLIHNVLRQINITYGITPAAL